MFSKAGTISLTEYRIAETNSFCRKITSKKFSALQNKLRVYVYPLLKRNPYCGPNIKKLKGTEYKSIFRYRLGNYRLFYKIATDSAIVFILDIAHRQNAYQ
ncbi:MAG: type II toxin-antitoxin system RelE/ParE family toxin [Candidatus Margulisbacteria bacterium]|jgi:mRNA interferase RelE/StbE|nr:type II toxin-antitoxin system RelE/ParE family toxin [Candidatus Margulisiibacteriota bacterium]